MEYKILVADDDTEMAKVLRTFFEIRKYTVITAVDGAETLKMVEMKPDIILLDINMPRIDGIEVLRRIRDKVSCPILFLTASFSIDRSLLLNNIEGKEVFTKTNAGYFSGSVEYTFED